MGNCNDSRPDKGVQQQGPGNNAQRDLYVQMEILSWQRESHSLYDYEQPNTNLRKVNVQASSIVNLGTGECRRTSVQGKQGASAPRARPAGRVVVQEALPYSARNDICGEDNNFSNNYYGGGGDDDDDYDEYDGEYGAKNSQNGNNDAFVQIIKLRDRAWLKLVHDAAAGSGGNECCTLHDDDHASHQQESHRGARVLQRAIQKMGASDSNNNNEGGDYCIDGDQSNRSQFWRYQCRHPAYLVINSYQQANGGRGYRLKSGDLLKIGRVRLRVADVVSDAKAAGTVVDNTKTLPEEDKASCSQDSVKCAPNNDGGGACTPLTASARVCKICLGEGATHDNPMVSPCKCSGTMQYVHVQCLQTWVQRKSANANIRFVPKKQHCELCKTSYPSQFVRDGVRFDMVHLSKPTNGAPYVVLEVFPVGSQQQQQQQQHQQHQGQGQQNTNSGGHLIVQLQKSHTLKLGRSHQCDVVLNDISVSRHHANLFYAEDGALYLRDNDSKFGTLVRLQSDFPITPDSRMLQIQVGRHLVRMSLAETERARVSHYAHLCCTTAPPPINGAENATRASSAQRSNRGGGGGDVEFEGADNENVDAESGEQQMVVSPRYYEAMQSQRN